MVFRTPGTLCSAATDTARESRGSAIIALFPVTFCLRHGTEFRLSFNEPWHFVRCPRPILPSYPMTITDVRSFQLGPAIAPLEKRIQTQLTHRTMEGVSTMIHPDKQLSRRSFLKGAAKAGAASFAISHTSIKVENCPAYSTSEHRVSEASKSPVSERVHYVSNGTKGPSNARARTDQCAERLTAPRHLRPKYVWGQICTLVLGK
jgi:hypothetical protein